MQDNIGNDLESIESVVEEEKIPENTSVAVQSHTPTFATDMTYFVASSTNTTTTYMRSGCTATIHPLSFQICVH